LALLESRVGGHGGEEDEEGSNKTEDLEEGDLGRNQE
jgi:hypothetical protein